MKEVRVVPFSDIYFGEVNVHSLGRGDKRFSLVLMSVGILILIFSIINYINLTMALHVGCWVPRVWNCFFD